MPLRREIRHYLRRMRRRKYRRRRRLAVCLCFAVSAYLMMMKGAGEAAFAVWEEQTVEYVLPSASPRGDRVFRIELRLREGEIRFFHERTGSLPNPGESDTQKSGNPSVNQPVKARKPAK